MNTYTIARETGKAIRDARLAQVRSAKKEMETAIQALPSPGWETTAIKKQFAGRLRSDFVRLHFINGTVSETALPVRILAEWLKTVPGWSIAVEITRDALILTAGVSRLRLNHWRAIPRRNSYEGNGTASIGLETLGAPVRLVAPANGGEFKLEIAGMEAATS